MKIGDLVQHTMSKSKMPGIIVDWYRNSSTERLEPIVCWPDGRCNWTVRKFVEVLDANG